MAISSYPLRLIATHLKGADVLSLGYPELLIHPQRVKEIFGYEPTKFSKALQHGKGYQIPETREFMDRVVRSFECVDVAKLQGTERVADLNYPQNLGSFDVVIDPGTLEHCFNVGQAFMNAANAVKAGGRIMHIAPVSMLNHGFYNFCPTLYKDFYEQNGWTIELIELYESTDNHESAGSLVGKESQRFPVLPEMGIICIARRGEKRPLRYPQQGKYVQMLTKALAA